MFANFAFAGARPRWSPVLARWQVDLARSSSPEQVPVSPLPLLKLAKALACLKSPPRGRNGSPEFLRPARGFLTVVLPSLPNSDDPETPLAHACLNSDDLTAAARSSAARCRSPLPGLIPSVRS